MRTHLELGEQQLGDEEHVGDQSGLENDGDIGGVEQLDGVGHSLSSVPLALDLDVDLEALNFNICALLLSPD